MKNNTLPKNLDRFFVKVILVLIRFYQEVLSPHFPPTCRYLPTCSEYAYQAYDKWGVLKGSYLSMRRLLSCHPFAESKADPVPEPCCKKQ